MNIHVNLDLPNSESISPGFDDTDSQRGNELAPSSAQVKLLVDDKVGPTSRDKLLTFIQQNLDTLDYPVKVDAQVAHFPIPQGSEGKISEIRQRLT